MEDLAASSQDSARTQLTDAEGAGQHAPSQTRPLSVREVNTILSAMHPLPPSILPQEVSSMRAPDIPQSVRDLAQRSSSLPTPLPLPPPRIPLQRTTRMGQSTLNIRPLSPIYDEDRGSFAQDQQMDVSGDTTTRTAVTLHHAQGSGGFRFGIIREVPLPRPQTAPVHELSLIHI